LRIRNHIVPLWLVVSVLICGVVSAAVTYYVWQTVTIPFKVNEPMQVISYPNELDLLPGETGRFNVTVENRGSIGYKVTLGFRLSNQTFKNSYVTFSNDTYNVSPGQQVLPCWLSVEENAPSTSISLSIDFIRLNATDTRVQEENLFLTKQHIWYNETGGWAESAIVIVNTGGKDVLLDKVAVRGQEASWSQVYYWRTNTVAISDDLATTPNALTGMTESITVQGSSRLFSQASTDLTLKSGYTMVIYIASPDSITLSDVGAAVGIAVFSTNAQYYKEANVAVAQTETYNIVSMSFTGTSNATNNAIILRVQNTGSSSFTIDTNGKVNGVTKTLAAQVNVAAGATSDITIPNVQWINGRQYNVELTTTRGTKITYTAVGPQT